MKRLQGLPMRRREFIAGLGGAAALTNINEFDRMNQVYATFFKAAPPARATVQVARLGRDVKIEISAIAVAP
jgi:enamine deaminase RidA (YjgF/YER057c/UK114 family)